MRSLGIALLVLGVSAASTSRQGVRERWFAAGDEAGTLRIEAEQAYDAGLLDRAAQAFEQLSAGADDGIRRAARFNRARVDFDRAEQSRDAATRERFLRQSLQHLAFLVAAGESDEGIRGSIECLGALLRPSGANRSTATTGASDPGGEATVGESTEGARVVTRPAAGGEDPAREGGQPRTLLAETYADFVQREGLSSADLPLLRARLEALHREHRSRAAAPAEGLPRREDKDW